jgi:hypothetical protein
VIIAGAFLQAGRSTPAGPGMNVSVIPRIIDSRICMASGLTKERTVAAESVSNDALRSPFPLRAIIVRRYSSSLDAPLLQEGQLGILSKLECAALGNSDLGGMWSSVTIPRYPQ